MDSNWITMDESDSRRFMNAVNLYRDVLGNRSEVAMRRGLIDLIKSIRKQTIRSKKKRKAEVVRRHGKAVKVIAKKGRFAGQKVKLFRVNVRGKWKYTVGDSISELKKSSFVVIKNSGLAKKSWGWLMHHIFSVGNPNSGGEAKIPEGALSGYWHKGKERLEFDLENALGYITSAVPKGAISTAVTAAEKSIKFKVEKVLQKARERANL